MQLADLIAAIGEPSPPPPGVDAYSKSAQPTTALGATAESILMAIGSVVDAKDNSGRQQEAKARTAICDRVQELAQSPSLSTVVSLIGKAQDLSGVSHHTITKVQLLLIDGLRRGIGQHTHSNAKRHGKRHSTFHPAGGDAVVFHPDVPAEVQRVALNLLKEGEKSGKDNGATVPLKLAQAFKVNLPIEPLNEFVLNCLQIRKWDSVVRCVTLQDILKREGCTVDAERVCEVLLTNYMWRQFQDIVKYWYGCGDNVAGTNEPCRLSFISFHLFFHSSAIYPSAIHS
jgi:hypothetical protein